MTNEQRDKLIIETANDVKWIKGWTVEHKGVHSKYRFYFVTAILAAILSWFR